MPRVCCQWNEAAQKVAPKTDPRHRIEHFGHFLVEAPALKTLLGQGFQPEEAITVDQALRMNTIWAAKSAHLEKLRGSIEVSKLADVVLLDADPLTVLRADLGKITPVMTIVDGRVAYQTTP